MILDIQPFKGVHEKIVRFTNHNPNQAGHGQGRIQKDSSSKESITYF